MSLNFNTMIHLPELTVDEAFSRRSGEPMITLSHPGGSWIDITTADLPELDALIAKLTLAKQRLEAAVAARGGGGS